MTQEITSLEQMLDRIAESADKKGRVSFGTIVESIGDRSFGPLLLLVGVIMTSPVSGMPGVPTTMGVLVLLIAGQLLFRRDHFWLPEWVLKRSLEQRQVYRAVNWLRPGAKLVDRLLRPRLPAFIRGISVYLISLICALIAAAMPMMELVPFSAHVAGLALTAFGLAIISRDGLLSLIAFLATSVAFGALVFQLV